VSSRDGGYKTMPSTLRREHLWRTSERHCLRCGMPRESVWYERIGVCIGATTSRDKTMVAAFQKLQAERAAK
jgi:hypothetical protein